MSKKTQYNQAQQILLSSFEGGEFAKATQAEIENCGDTLFKFLLAELSDAEGCDSLTEAYHRLTVAEEQINSVLMAVSKPLVLEHLRSKT